MNERNEKLIYVCSLMPGECTCDPESRMFCVHSRQRKVERRSDEDDEYGNDED